MNPFEETSDLVVAARCGMPGAQDALLDVSLPLVLGWCRRLGGSRVDPEDAAHDVLIVVLTRLDQLQRPARFESWLYGITRRVLASHRRRAWVRRWASGTVVEPIDDSIDALRAAELSQAAAEVRDVLDRLPVKQREVLVLCDVEDRTDVEAAELLQVPVGTVKSRLRGARSRFRSMAARRVTLTTLCEAPSWGQG